ncbi:MAG: universal stress protein, partial [Gallionella sp.]|nr:universal stress protein [Gallionella sp.]
MYKRILVPVDGSETSNKALVAALQLAKDAGGRVRLVHVIEELAYQIGYEQCGGYSGELITVMREAGTKVLNDGMDMAKAAGVDADNMLFD